ncbi:hypothetical protein POX_b02063 [Penicillium oxalicum]|uniref:hypothetical protein n=1 Tax=Penicillium oxalicum TaxID=69781 RepID=UPI0020B71429|nr:hypothetical protein POX_b02063 [Penicillium oxalicum]KAI2792030.1 hypothetical protein POX_b02063 [Penicillium oxalicum]
MERDFFFLSTKDKVAKENRRKRLESNGYVVGAHTQADSVRNKDRRLRKTKRRYNKAVRDWVDFAEENGIKGYTLGSSCAAPDHTLIKEFLRWYSYSARGQKAKQKHGRPVMKSVLSCAERLFGGFEESMQINIVLEDRKEVFNWIKRTLTE